MPNFQGRGSKMGFGDAAKAMADMYASALRGATRASLGLLDEMWFNEVEKVRNKP